MAATRNSSSSVPPSVLVIVLRWNAVAIRSSRLGLGQQVAGDLQEGEPVIRQVAVEGVDDPVAIAPDVGPQRVGAVAGRVGVAGQVEPDPGPALAVGGVVEEAVDGPLVGARGLVADEALDLLGRRRQAAQVQAGAAQERVAVGLGRGLQPLLLQPVEDPEVDAVPRPGRVAHLRQGQAIREGSRPSAGRTRPPARSSRRRISTSAGVSRLPVFLGGMRSVSSSSVTRAISSLESGSPGTIAASPLLSGLMADSRTSSRSPLARFASSWPWQAKQFFARIGRTSRLKSTFRFGRGCAGLGGRNKARRGEQSERSAMPSPEQGRSRTLAAWRGDEASVSSKSAPAGPAAVSRRPTRAGWGWIRAGGFLFGRGCARPDRRLSDFLLLSLISSDSSIERLAVAWPTVHTSPTAPASVFAGDPRWRSRAGIRTGRA